MVTNTEKVEKILKTLYYTEKEGQDRFTRGSFDKIMESNETRLNYLNHLFNAVKKNELNEYCFCIFKDNIDFLYEFMNGGYRKEFHIPIKYFKDKDECLIVPTQDELEYLFELLEANKEMYELLYKDKKFILELPKKSFNQNMTRVLEIHEHNLAHLVGLTETEIELDPRKNVLKKYFLNNIGNIDKYGQKDSEKLWNWVLSEEGKNELRRLNSITLDFIDKDKIKFPNNYDSNGVIKPISLPKFKERFKKEIGLEFPIIRFSRCITKSINNLNFLNLNNTTEIILDYNVPNGRDDEKDIFIVNAAPETLLNESEDYLIFKLKVMDIITSYANDDRLKELAKELMDELGIKSKDKDISSFINLIKTSKFLTGIEPNNEVSLEKINNVISEYFDRNIHLIGFDTDFKENNIPLRKSSVNNAHCDTSISLTVAELVGDYYKRGRVFFLDKIYDGSESKLLRLSNPKEEITYNKQMNLLEPQFLKNNEGLQKKLESFNKKYAAYKNTLGNNKRR